MLAQLLQLVHVLVAMLFVGGLVGRTVVSWRGERSNDIDVAAEYVAAAGTFDRYLVQPMWFVVLLSGLVTMWAQGRPLIGPASWWLVLSLALVATMIPVIVLVFIPRGRGFEATLQEAQRQGVVTPELRSAFADPMVRVAHVYEAFVVVIIIALMVTKPF